MERYNSAVGKQELNDLHIWSRKRREKEGEKEGLCQETASADLQK